MASSKDASYKQDLVVSIRYRNDLPPPPMPPKFLVIDTGGIQQYLSPSYASSLARREVPNIDADAEGGMPIDMVGMPGYFLGDESAIMAEDVRQALDPEDQELMLNIEQLRTLKTKQNVSFLRKTQYMTAATGNTGAPIASRPTPRKRMSMAQNPQQSVDRDDPENIKRVVQKGFDLAYPDSIPFNPPEIRSQPSNQAERDAWRNPRHPTNSRAQPVSFHPVLPDLEAGVDATGWSRFKFEKPPLPPNHLKRDRRIDAGIFFTTPDKSREEDWQARHDAWEKDPEHYDYPGPQPHKYSLHVPRKPEDVASIKKHVFRGHPEADDQEVVAPITEENEDGVPRVAFERARVYPQVQHQTVDPRRFMAIGLYSPASTKNSIPPTDAKQAQGPAAYYYPIFENIRLKADRKISVSGRDDIEDLADTIFAAPTEPSAEQNFQRNEFRGKYDLDFAEEYKRLEQIKEEEDRKDREEWQQAQAEIGEDGMEGVETNGVAEANGHVNGIGADDAGGEDPAPGGDEDVDATGMEDD